MPIPAQRGWLCMTGLLAACGEAPTRLPAYPSVIFHNGPVVTMAAGTGTAEALAIAADRVLVAGSAHAVLRLAGPGTRLVDLEGRTILPGIVDAHTHLFNDAEQYLGLDLAGAQALALENGITTLGNLFVPEEFVASMRAFAASGGLKIRTSLYLTHIDNCGRLGPGNWWSAYPPTRTFGERLRIGGIKVFADGGTCGRPAMSVEFSPGSGYGDLYLDAPQVADIVTAAEETGHQVVIHAIGHRAIRAAQDGIAAVLQGRPNALRHRIDHNVMVPPDVIPRYAEVGIHPVLFGQFLYFQEMFTEPWPSWPCAPTERNEFYEAYMNNTRRVLDELPGLHVAWHGDDPWVSPLGPFRELYVMVTRIWRRDAGTSCPPPEWLLATSITAAEGLRMMTWNSAYALFREAEVGSLEPGKLADLLVVDRNPLTVAPEALWDVQVVMTMIGGEVLFCRQGQAGLC